MSRRSGSVGALGEQSPRATRPGFPREARNAAVGSCPPVKRTCTHHDIDFFAYLRDILRRLPSQPADQLEELLPDA